MVSGKYVFSAAHFPHSVWPLIKKKEKKDGRNESYEILRSMREIGKKGRSDRIGSLD